MTPETGRTTPSFCRFAMCSLRRKLGQDGPKAPHVYDMRRLDLAADRQSFNQRHDCFEWFMILAACATHLPSPQSTLHGRPRRYIASASLFQVVTFLRPKKIARPTPVDAGGRDVLPGRRTSSAQIAQTRAVTAPRASTVDQVHLLFLRS
jgi:hypothetical protein